MTRCLLIIYCKTHLDFRDVKIEKKKSVMRESVEYGNANSIAVVYQGFCAPGTLLMAASH